MDAGFIDGFVTGFSTGALVVGLLFRDRSLKRSGPSQADIAADQERYFAGPPSQQPPVGGIDRTPQTWWVNRSAEQNEARWQASQQQEQPIQQNPYPGGGRTVEEAAAYWCGQTPKQQEASNQRSPEAMGGLGNVPSNVVSKEG